ncbi:MAG: phage tail protein [Candidatus Gastranaerophilales bacterium]|nr:phage tail protein [Candidatus Gastranaerophilales bacterium]
MYRFDDVESTFLSLPPNLQTTENECFGYALDRQMKRMHKLAKQITVWSNLDDVDPKYYDSLAITIRAPYYKSEYGDKQKLGLIKSALLTRRNAGTLKAIEELLSHTLINAVFIPWYKYGGKPYHFKIIVDADETDDSSLREFIRKIASVKSARSIFEGAVIVIIIYNVEQIVLRNVRFKMKIPFWYELTFDGSWLLDGSVILNAKRRYGLVLGFRSSQGRVHTPERIHLFSVRFTKAKVKISEIVGVRARFCFGTDFWDTRYFDGSWLLDGSVILNNQRRYGLILGMPYRLMLENRTEDIQMRTLTARWEQRIAEDIAAKAGVHLEVEPLADRQEKMVCRIHLEVDFSEQEMLSNFTVETKTPDYWYFNGKFLFDGTKKFNSKYEMEEI